MSKADAYEVARRATLARARALANYEAAESAAQAASANAEALWHVYLDAQRNENEADAAWRLSELEHDEVTA